MGNILNKIHEFFNNHKYLKIGLIVLLIGFISFQLRAQPADMGFTDNPQLKSMFADENGRMYLVALDPYYYLRLTENYYHHGHLGETLKEVDGKLVPYDTCQYAPPGHPAPTEVPAIIYATLAIYYIWHSFDSTVSLMNAAFWVPAVLGMLLGIPVYFIVRRVTLSNIGGIVGALAIISSPTLLYKTSAGFADTPIFEVLPILFIVWFIMEAIHYQENLKKSLIFAGLATIIMALAPRMWSGWWYGYDIVSGFLLIYVLCAYVIKKYYKKSSIVEFGDIKNVLSIIGVFIVGSALLISILYGINAFIGGMLSPIGYQEVLTTTEHASGWPNVFTTVSELATPSIDEIIYNSLGSRYLFVCGIIGIFLSFASMRYNDMKIKLDLKYAILLSLWIVATGYAATKGIRFVGLMVPPLSIGIGIFAGQIVNIIKRRDDDLTKWILYPIISIVSLIVIISNYNKIPEILIPTTYVPFMAYGTLLIFAILAIYKIIDIIINKEVQTKKIISVLLGIALILPPLANAVPMVTVPTLNNGWLDSLNWIKTETPNNSVITCWWDNGHIYTWATRKMVTFDGGSQNTPRAYWVGRVYSTSNENLSIGILRMLATSGDEAFKEDGILMNKTNHSVKKTVEILNEILPLDKTSAYKILTEKYNLTRTEAEEVLNATHPENPNPDYLITYNRMTTKIAPVWSMFGMWDYSLPADTPDKKREMGFYQNLKGEGFLINNTLVVRVPLQQTKDYATINLIMVKNSTMTSYDIAYNLKTGKVISEKSTAFHKVIVKDGDRVYENTFNENGTISEIVRLKPIGNGQYYAYVWISSRNLEDSIYTKLHLLDGYGLKHIKLVKESIDPTNYGIQPGFKVYKVDYGKEYLK